MDFREYRGIRGLVIAEITKDDSTTFTTGKWMELSGVQAVSKSTNESSEAHYYDNVAAIIIDGEGSDEYTLTVSVLAKKTKALIEGTYYSETNGVLVNTPKNKKYFALGFIGEDTNGKEEINIVYKGKFSGGNETYNTKTDGTDATGVEYTFTAIHSTFKDTLGTGKASFKSLQVEVSDAVTEEKVFGTMTAGESDKEALKPSEIIALTKTA